MANIKLIHNQSSDPALDNPNDVQGNSFWVDENNPDFLRFRKRDNSGFVDIGGSAFPALFTSDFIDLAALLTAVGTDERSVIQDSDFVISSATIQAGVNLIPQNITWKHEAGRFIKSGSGILTLKCKMFASPTSQLFQDFNIGDVKILGVVLAIFPQWFDGRVGNAIQYNGVEADLGYAMNCCLESRRHRPGQSYIDAGTVIWIPQGNYYCKTEIIAKSPSRIAMSAAMGVSSVNYPEPNQVRIDVPSDKDFIVTDDAYNTNSGEGNAHYSVIENIKGIFINRRADGNGTSGLSLKGSTSCGIRGYATTKISNCWIENAPNHSYFIDSITREANNFAHKSLIDWSHGENCGSYFDDGQIAKGSSTFTSINAQFSKKSLGQLLNIEDARKLNITQVENFPELQIVKCEDHDYKVKIITSVPHGFKSDQYVRVSGVQGIDNTSGGWTLNDVSQQIKVIDEYSFTLVGSFFNGTYVANSGTVKSNVMLKLADEYGNSRTYAEMHPGANLVSQYKFIGLGNAAVNNQIHVFDDTFKVVGSSNEFKIQLVGVLDVTGTTTNAYVKAPLLCQIATIDAVNNSVGLFAEGNWDVKSTPIQVGFDLINAKWNTRAYNFAVQGKQSCIVNFSNNKSKIASGGGILDDGTYGSTFINNDTIEDRSYPIASFGHADFNASEYRGNYNEGTNFYPCKYKNAGLNVTGSINPNGITYDSFGANIELSDYSLDNSQKRQFGGRPGQDTHSKMSILGGNLDKLVYPNVMENHQTITNWQTSMGYRGILPNRHHIPHFRSAIAFGLRVKLSMYRNIAETFEAKSTARVTSNIIRPFLYPDNIAANWKGEGTLNEIFTNSSSQEAIGNRTIIVGNAKVKVNHAGDGDFVTFDPNFGFVGKSPDGTWYRAIFANGGTWAITPISDTDVLARLNVKFADRTE